MAVFGQLEGLCLGEMYKAKWKSGQEVIKGMNPKIIICGDDGLWNYYGFLTTVSSGKPDFEASVCIRGRLISLKEDAGEFVVRVYSRGMLTSHEGPWTGHATAIPAEGFVKRDFSFEESCKVVRPQRNSTILMVKCLYLYGKSPNVRVYSADGKKGFAHLGSHASNPSTRRDDKKYIKFVNGENRASQEIIDALQPGDALLARLCHSVAPIAFCQPVVNIRGSDKVYDNKGIQISRTNIYYDGSALLIDSLPVVMARKIGNEEAGIGFVPRHRDDTSSQFYKEVVIIHNNALSRRASKGAIVNAVVRVIDKDYLRAEVTRVLSG